MWPARRSGICSISAPGENPAIGNADLMSYPTVGVDLDVPVAALSARPDIRASEARLQSAFKTLESDRASWYPTISIGSTLGTSSSTSSKVFALPLARGYGAPSASRSCNGTPSAGTSRFPKRISNRRNWIHAGVTSALNEWTQPISVTPTRSARWKNTLSKTPERTCASESTTRPLRSRCRRAQKDYLDALNTADNSMLSALEAKYRVIRYENQIYKAMGGRYERILPPSGGKATQGHTSTNGETHVPSQRNQ